MADTNITRNATTAALDAYGTALGEPVTIITPDADIRDRIVDLMADLHHYCDRAGFDWVSMVDEAQGHHAAEERR